MQRTRAMAWIGFVSAVVLGSSFAALALAGGTATPSAQGPAWGPWSNPGPNYTVTFTETGLPAGTNWTVGVFITPWFFEDFGAQFNTSNTSTLTFSLPNGTYHFHVFRANGNGSFPHRGMFTVNGTSPPPISVHFGPPKLYTVTLTEVGLPAGTLWAVRVQNPGGWGDPGWFWQWGGEDAPVAAALHGGWWGWHHGGWGGFNISNTSTLTLNLPNGTYNYSVFCVPGFSFVGPSNGTINISGASPPAIHVTFAALPAYVVTFVESGLPAGTNWTVAVGGVGDMGTHWGHFAGRSAWLREHFIQTSDTTTISFNLTNGTYRYFAGWAEGYYSNSSFGKFNVSGAGLTIQINFTALPVWNMTFGELGLPHGSDWGIVVTGSTGHVAGGAQHVVKVEAGRSTSLTVSLPSGHYRFHVLSPGGWSAAAGPSARGFAIAGAPSGATFTFSAAHGGARPAVLSGGPGVPALVAGVRSVLGLVGALPQLLR